MDQIDFCGYTDVTDFFLSLLLLGAVRDIVGIFWKLGTSIKNYGGSIINWRLVFLVQN
jgi:hypothetical protein